MAAEGRQTLGFTSTRAGNAISFNVTSQGMTIAADASIQDVYTVASSAWQAITLGSITGTAGMIAIQNLDASNFIQVALDNAGAQVFARILPSLGAMFPPQTNTMYWKADTAPCNAKVAACSGPA
jgi:hypothetical protein